MISRNFALGLAVALGIGAYPLLAALMSLAGGGETRLASIVVRLAVVVVALAATWLNRKSMRGYHPVFLASFVIFWCLYIYRVIHNSYISQIELGADPIEVLALIFAFVLLPTLPMFAGLNPWSTKWGFRLLTGITAVSLALVLMQLSELAVLLQEAGAIRFSLEKLNPISVGYLGATMVVLSAVGVFRPSRNRVALVNQAFFALCGAAGVFTLVIAASRGPAIAIAVAMLIYCLVPFRPGRAVVGLGLIGAGAVGVSIVRRFVLARYEFDIYSRFLDAAEGYDNSANAREEAYAGAWQQFINNPFFGDAIVERSTGGYPHNLILEALMATGFLGGIAYILMVGLMAVAALRLLNREDGYEWLALLAIVFGLSGMFSGTHYTSDIQWLTLVLVTVTEIKLRSSAAEAQLRRRAKARAQADEAETFAPPRNRVEKELMQGESP